QPRDSQHTRRLVIVFFHPQAERWTDTPEGKRHLLGHAGTLGDVPPSAFGGSRERPRTGTGPLAEDDRRKPRGMAFHGAPLDPADVRIEQDVHAALVWGRTHPQEVHAPPAATPGDLPR